MNFNKYYNQLLKSLNESEPFQPEYNNKRQAYAITVTLWRDSNKDSITPLDKVDFYGDGDDCDGWSQWWDANHQDLYTGPSYEKALRVFEEHLSSIANTQEFEIDTITHRVVDQIAKVSHIEGAHTTWRVLRLDDDVVDAPTICIGFEVKGLAFMRQHDLLALSQTIDDPELKELF